MSLLMAASAPQSARHFFDRLRGALPLVDILPFVPHGEAAAQPASFVVAVNLEGEVVHNLQDQNNPFHYITGVTPCGDTLYLGSLQTVAIGALPAP